MPPPYWTHFVTWFLILLGWYFVHLATLSRDRRKEKRDISTQVCKSILDLQADAIDFHTAAKCEVRKSTDVSQMLDRIVIQLQKKPLSELEIPLALIIDLRQGISMNNIDPTGFEAQAADSDIVLNIRNAATDMIFAIEDARERVWK